MRIQSNQNFTKLSSSFCLVFKIYRLRQIEKTYGYVIDQYIFLFQNTSPGSLHYAAIGKNIPRFLTSVCQNSNLIYLRKSDKNDQFCFFYCCCYTYYMNNFVTKVKCFWAKVNFIDSWTNFYCILLVSIKILIFAIFKHKKLYTLLEDIKEIGWFFFITMNSFPNEKSVIPIFYTIEKQ